MKEQDYNPYTYKPKEGGWLLWRSYIITFTDTEIATATCTEEFIRSMIKLLNKAYNCGRTGIR